MEIVKEYMTMLTDAEVQEFCDFKVDYFYEVVNHEEALENQNFVSDVGEDETTLFCCNSISIEDENILHNDILQEILAIELLNDSLVLEQGTLCNAEESIGMRIDDNFITFAEGQYKELMAESPMKIENHSYFEFDNCDGNYVLYMNEESYANDMLIEYEGIYIFLGRLLDEPNNMEERIIFDDNER